MFKRMEKKVQGIDLHPKTIKKLFEKQVRELTIGTIIQKEDSFDLQFSGGW